MNIRADIMEEAAKLIEQRLLKTMSSSKEAFSEGARYALTEAIRLLRSSHQK